MEQDEALARMHEIQRIMERTTLCTLLPGPPAVIGGALALAGGLVHAGVMESFDFVQTFALPLRLQLGLLGMWAAIAVTAVILDFVLTARTARRQGFEPLGRPVRLAILSLTPTMVVAVVLTAKLLLDAGNLAFVGSPIDSGIDLTWRPDPRFAYIVPIWMMCYGLGVYSAGLFSVRAPRVLGLAFVFAGAAGLLFFADYGVLLLALSFGLFHVVFGLSVISKARRGVRS